ncbi:MAG TPA: putative Ig domain-containing protein [Terriglobia bacterium]|nr:putative Ig domain-containing protein [Terriglobia bacterium]
MYKTKLNMILAGTLVVLCTAINSKAVSVSTFSLPNAIVGNAYSSPLAATGGIAPYTWKATSTLPAGISLGTGGMLKGIPTTAGTYSINFLLTDAAGASAKETLTLTVVKGLSTTTADPTNSTATSGSTTAPAPAISSLKITTTSLTNGTVGIAYSGSLLVTGGRSPYSWTIQSGALPPGMTLGGGGLFKGTPTGSGSYSFTVHVLDSSDASASYTYSLTIVTP